MEKILIVEDDPAMQRGLKDNLEMDGYKVVVAGDGEGGLAQMIDNTFDLVLLDVMLPGMSGFDLLKKARERGISVPVMMLTAKGEEVDKVLGLELGADDYITKPFSLRELLARVRAVLRRREGTGPPGGAARIVLGEVTVDFQAYRATHGSESLEMTPKEIDILRFLWEHRNRVVSRDQLLTNVWGYEESVSTRTVDNFILKLRQKIEKDPSRPRHIITIHGIGYKLLA